MKICKNCKWYADCIGGFRCRHAETSRVDNVTGANVFVGCYHARGAMNPCGPEGNLFEWSHL